MYVTSDWDAENKNPSQRFPLRRANTRGTTQIASASQQIPLFGFQQTLSTDAADAGEFYLPFRLSSLRLGSDKPDTVTMARTNRQFSEAPVYPALSVRAFYL